MSLPLDSPVSHSQQQEGKREKTITEISGRKLLELSRSADPLGLLEKMLVESLNSISTPYLRTWKARVTPKRGALILVLRASVLPIKGQGSGLLPTPRTGGGSRPNQKGGKVLEEEVLIAAGLRERGKTLAQMRMLPTPRSCEMEGGVVKNVELNKGSFSRKNKKGVRYGVKLKDAVHYLEKQKLLPTPCARDYRDTTVSPANEKRRTLSLPVVVMKQEQPKTGGKLNPNFVEYLMGYSTDYTKIEEKE